MLKFKNVDNVVNISADPNSLVLLCPKYGSKFGFPELMLTAYFPEICIKEEEDPAGIAIRSVRRKEHTRFYWMAPFREYSYQISGSIDGDGCFGDTPVLGLHNLFHATFSDGYQSSNTRWGYGKITMGHASFQIFKALAYQCLDSFYNWGSTDIYRYDGVKTNFSGKEYERYSERGDMLDRYTMAVLIYLAMREERYDLISKEDYEWYFSLPRLTEDSTLLSGTKASEAIEIPMKVLEIMCPEEETIKEEVL